MENSDVDISLAIILSWLITISLKSEFGLCHRYFWEAYSLLHLSLKVPEYHC